MPDNSQDKVFVEVFLSPLRKCSKYRPAFGRGRSDGISLEDFGQLYDGDPFYAWIGLNDPLVYAAHKAAGGLTSVYRQIGVGGERLLRAVIVHSLQVTENQIDWRYEYPKPNGQLGLHSLDAKLLATDLSSVAKTRLTRWLASASKVVSTSSPTGKRHKGAVFEIRQGYKSADSKRQNADLRFGMHAYQAGLLPVFAILSSQVSEPVIRRYRADGMLVLTGVTTDDPLESTFAFFREVVGYDLAAFFKRNHKTIRSEVKAVLGGLLKPE